MDRNWGYARGNLKTNARLSLSGNLLLCVGVTAALLFAQLLFSLLSSSLSGSAAIADYLYAWLDAQASQDVGVVTPDMLRPLHSILALVLNAGWQALVLPLLLGLSELMLLAPFNVGLSDIYIRLVRKNGQEAKELKFARAFSWYAPLSRSGKAFLLSLLTALLRAMWFLLFCAPPAVLLYFYENQIDVTGLSQLSGSYPAPLLMILLLLLAGAVFAAVRGGAYMPAPFLLSSRPEDGVAEIIRESQKLMRGRLWEYFMLELSFILWYMASALTVFLYLYFIPYRTACQAIFVRKLQFESFSRHFAPRPEDEQVQV